VTVSLLSEGCKETVECEVGITVGFVEQGGELRADDGSGALALLWQIGVLQIMFRGW
jgi:hypothetical protein